MADAFAHHVWATERLIDSCAGLTDDQLATTVPGTYGSILDTVRHTVGTDCIYLYVIGRGRHDPVDEDTMNLAQLKDEWATHGAAWTEIWTSQLDPDEKLVRHPRRWVHACADGAPPGAGAASRHRPPQPDRTALTQLGIEPPDIDLWALRRGARPRVGDPDDIARHGRSVTVARTMRSPRLSHTREELMDRADTVAADSGGLPGGE